MTDIAHEDERQSDNESPPIDSVPPVPDGPENDEVRDYRIPGAT